MARVMELKKHKKESSIQSFKNMLKQKLSSLKLDDNTKWKEIKKLLRDDLRYKELKSSTMRENLFEEYLMDNILITPG